MTLSEREQRQLHEIELELVGHRRSAPKRAGHTSPASKTAIRLLIGLFVLVVAVVLTFSEADGLTLLIGCGLLATIVFLHRYNANQR